MAESAKTSKKRTVRPVYAIMSVTGTDGEPMEGLTKENVTIHSVHKDAGEVLDKLDTGSMPPGTFYKRVALV